MTRPTEEAKWNLNMAYSQTRRLIHDDSVPEHIRTLAFGLEFVAHGLTNMAIAQRATYILLEDLKNKLDQRGIR